MKNSISRLLALFCLTSIWGFAAQAETLSLAVSVENSKPGFTKFLYSFPLPEGRVQWTDLTGSVSLTLKSGRYSEVLMSIHYLPSGSCPSNGTQFSTYDQIGKAYPKMVGLENIILKEPAEGRQRTLYFDQKLPVPVPVSGCVVLIMDGGPAIGNAVINMSSNLVFGYTFNQAPTQAPYFLGGGSEFCFGQNWGCQSATAAADKSFSYAVQVRQDSKLLALLGDISNSSFDGKGTFGALPSGKWNTSTDFYLLRGGCGAFPIGSSNAGDFYAKLPASAVPLLSVPLFGVGRDSLQSSVYQVFDNMTVHANDCIVSLVKMSGNGGVDAENQVKYLLQPLPQTSTHPTSNSAKRLVIYMLTNGRDHMTSPSKTEAAPFYHLENSTINGGRAFSLTYGGANTRPLYRCWYAGGHFVSIDKNCEGQHIDGVLGWAAIPGTPATAGLTPLYRMFNRSTGAHFETVSTAQALRDGYVIESILGYVAP